jgi:hypothetical protein
MAPDLSLHISPPSPAPATEPRLELGLADDTAVAAAKTTTDDERRRQPHQPIQTAHGFKKSSGSGGGGKRSARAPRMRWTTALHAHFVHAVELLGGHESMFMLAPHNNNNKKKKKKLTNYYMYIYVSTCIHGYSYTCIYGDVLSFDHWFYM